MVARMVGGPGRALVRVLLARRVGLVARASANVSEAATRSKQT